MTIDSALMAMARQHALLTTAQAAALMGVTPWWVRQLIGSGELRGVNVGSVGTATRWRVDPEDLATWIARRQSRPRDMVATSSHR